MREANTSTPNLADGKATVFCQPGEVATGGGWNLIQGGITNFDVFGDGPLKADGKDAGPGDTPIGWRASVWNHSGQTDAWRVYVICASP